jgi:AAA domain
VSDDLVLVADVERERVTWLWPGRIPRRKVVVLDGDPGLGKSVLTLTIAAKVSTGSPFPDGERPEVADVILLSAEDDIGDTIRPRLEAAGADLSRCWVLPDITPQVAAEEKPQPPRPPELPADLDALEGMVKDKGAALVVIDPLMAFLSSQIDSHKDQDVRKVLAPLGYMASRTGAAVVVVRHMNKGQGGSALYRGSGSIGIAAAARAGLLVAPDPDDEGRRILAVSKSNLGAKASSLAYRIVEDELYKVARVVWDGASKHTASDLVRPRVDEEEAPALAEAVGVLKEILADGPLAAGNVKRMAATAGVAERTLQRARHALGVTARRQGIRARRHLRVDHARRPSPGHGTRHARHGCHGCHVPRGSRGRHACTTALARRGRCPTVTRSRGPPVATQPTTTSIQEMCS